MAYIEYTIVIYNMSGPLICIHNIKSIFRPLNFTKICFIRFAFLNKSYHKIKLQKFQQKNSANYKLHFNTKNFMRQKRKLYMRHKTAHFSIIHMARFACNFYKEPQACTRKCICNPLLSTPWDDVLRRCLCAMQSHLTWSLRVLGR